MKEAYTLIERNASGKTQELFAQLIQHDGGKVVGWGWEPPPSSCNSVGATPAAFTSSVHIYKSILLITEKKIKTVDRKEWQYFFR